MPTSREATPNTRLSGEELKVILRRKFDHLLANEGMLSAHVAFGRVSYRITLDMHIDNPFHPESKIVGESNIEGVNLIEKDPKLGALERPPLDNPSLDAAVASSTLTHNITSPNVARIHNGLSVPVNRTQQDGTTIRENVTYPLDRLPDLPEEDVSLMDTSAKAAQEWGQPLSFSPQAAAQEAEVEAANAVECKCGHPKLNHALSGICTQCGEEKCPTFRDAQLPDPEPAAKQAWPVDTSDSGEPAPA